MKNWIKLLRDYAGHKAGDLVEVEPAIARAYVDSGYAEESTAPESALAATARAEITAAVEELGRSLTTELRNVVRGAASGFRIEAGEQEADRTRSLSDQVRCIQRAAKFGDKDAFERLQRVYRSDAVGEDGRIIRVYEEAVGANAGYLLAPEYSTDILRVPNDMASFAGMVTTVPMQSQVKFMPALRQTGNPAAGSSAFFGGVQTYRKSEKAQRTPSQAAFDQIELKATDLIAYTEATNDLLADAPGSESFFVDLFRQAIVSRKDWDFIRGTGSGEPEGFLTNTTATINVTRNAANDVKFVDVTTMLSKLLPSSMGRAVWLASITTLPKLCALQDGAGNAIWVNMSQGATLPIPGLLFGRPVYILEYMSPLGTRGDLCLVDPKMYLEGLRSGVEIAVSKEFKFDTDLTAWRVKTRNDGMIWMKSTVKLSDGANTTVSPFVFLN